MPKIDNDPATQTTTPAAAPTAPETVPVVPPAETEKKAKAEFLPMPDDSNRKVIYEDVDVQLYRLKDGKPFTADHAKKFLGWTEEPDGVKFGPVFHLLDENKKKVRLLNNTSNRPFDRKLAQTWQAEILKGNWKLNGETMIVGRTGLNISIQHRCAGLVLAEQLYDKNPDAWPAWKSRPTIDAIVAVGIDEDDATINTVDTGKPRGLDDVLYRSEYFKDMKPAERRACSKITAHALKVLGDRTWAWVMAYAPKRTHAEQLDLLSRHERLLKCVKHIVVEDDPKRKIGKYISLGYASAFLYLMAASATDPKEYQGLGEDASELHIDWKFWDKAQDFWVEFAGASETLRQLRFAIGSLSDPKIGLGAGGSVTEKMIMIAKAWMLYKQDKKIRPNKDENKVSPDLAIRYSKDQDEINHINPEDLATIFDGIDRGPSKDADEDDDETTTATEPVVTEQEAEAAKADERRKRAEALAEKMKKDREAKAAAEANGAHAAKDIVAADQAKDIVAAPTTPEPEKKAPKKGKKKADKAPAAAK